MGISHPARIRQFTRKKWAFALQPCGAMRLERLQRFDCLGCVLCDVDSASGLHFDHGFETAEDHAFAIK
ncbi:MAG: hypothetical protein KKH21_06090, partial [Gammaproteobacteria bacterium]|nr:hypothetical protein [Gammaproteobacteria bacterium]